MRRLQVVGSVLFVCLIASCGLTPPKPAESEYFVSSGGGFNFDRETKTAEYGLTIESRGNVNAGNFLEVRYQNPTGGEPIVTGQLVDEGQTRFVLTSPPVQGLKAYTSYKVEIRLFETESKTALLGTHIQRLQNLVNQADLGW